MTTGRVDTLQIKPLVTHLGETGRRTSITSFNDMLRAQKAEEKQTEKTTTKDTASQSGVYFRDPTTGNRVKYVEVGSTAPAKAGTADKSASATKTTSASSMKTTKYDEYFKKAAQKYDVPESLLKAIAKAESNFNARDVSGSGAMGVMQLMPETARGLGVDDPFDPEQNIMGGAKCIAQKLKEFNGDVKLALAAYNAGSGSVRRAGGVPSRCNAYVNKVLSYQKAYEAAAKV